MDRAAEIFEQRLLKVLQDRQFWPQEKAVFLLAYSGGPDSQALLQALMRLKRIVTATDFMAGSTFVVCHFNHGWRPDEAEAEERFCQNAAAYWDLPYESGTVATLQKQLGSGNLPPDALGETAARRYRHAFLQLLQERYEALSGQAVYILLGHQWEDRVETLLLNLFRGSGLEGLTAMPAKQGRVLRPLLSFKKTELLEYLQHIAVDFLYDSSNDEPITGRNRLRHEVMPLLNEIFAKPDLQLLRCSDQLNALKNDLLYPAVKAALSELDARKWTVQSKQGERLAALYVQKSKLVKIPAILHPYLWKQLIAELMGENRDLTAAHYSLLDEALGLSKSRGLAFYASSFLASDRQSIRLWQKNPEQFSDSSFLACEIEPHGAKHFLLLGPAADARTQSILIEKVKPLGYNLLTWFQRGSAMEQGTWRTRQKGDFVRLKNGQHKTLKKFMSEQRIPVELRDCCLIFCRKHEVLFLPTYFDRLADVNEGKNETVGDNEVQHD